MLKQIDEEVAPDSQPLEGTEPAAPTTEMPLDGMPSEEMPPAAPPPESKLKMKARELGYQDDDYESYMSDYVADLEGFKQRSEEVNSALWDAIEADPALRETLKITAIDGKPFLVAIHSVFTPEELQALPDDPIYGDVENTRQSRQTKLEADRKRKAEMESNSELSQQAITEFATENNLSEQEATEFLGTVDKILEDVYSGKVTKEFLASMRRALTADKEVEEAMQMGEIAGRNANIETNIINKPMGDGLPSLQTGGEIASTAPGRKKTSIERIVEEDQKRVKLK